MKKFKKIDTSPNKYEGIVLFPVKLLSNSEALNDIEQETLNNTLKRVSKTKPTLPNRK